MTQTAPQLAAFALSALMTLAVVAGMNGIAATQYTKADRRVMASTASAQVALQQVTIVGHRASV